MLDWERRPFPSASVSPGKQQSGYENITTRTAAGLGIDSTGTVSAALGKNLSCSAIYSYTFS
jgi:hypothetical protein